MGKIINDFRLDYRNDGLLYALKNSIIPVLRWKLIERTDIAHVFLSRVLGPSRAFKMVMFLYDLRCKMHLFLGREKFLQLGKSLNAFAMKKRLVNPEKIKYQIKEGCVPFIQSGNWDTKKIPFELHPTIKELYLLDPPIPVKETTQYKLMTDRLNKGLHTYWCKNQQDVDQYFKEIIHICDEIKSGKYKCQEEIDDTLNKSGKGRYPNEVILSVDRNGDYIHEKGGSHRLSMAKISGIKEIPVVVIRYHHSYYVQNREMIKRG